MSIKQTTIFVDGMTCPSCEAAIDRALKKLDGVIGAKAALRGGTVIIDYDDQKTGVAAMEAAITEAGYAIRRSAKSGTGAALAIALILAAAYLVAGAAGLFNNLPGVTASLGYGMLFAVGLLTSVHCVAMCGGIALSQSVGSAECAGTKSEKLVPGLLYNGGRVVSYTVIGGAVGALGSVLGFSPLFKTLIAGAAGVFMVLLSLKMLGVFSSRPFFSRLIPAIAHRAAGRIRSGLGKRGPFAVGILNGLMPCGPLQTMQLYALGTGSLLAGALSMFIFSLGTVPLLLGFSVAAALLPRRFMPVMIRTSAILVLFLGVVTLGRAASFSGISTTLPSITAAAAPALPAATVENGSQSVLTVFGANDYAPFAVQAGVPLKWTIRIAEADLNGCNGTVIVPAYGIEKTLQAGDNLIEFTPKAAGVIGYSCWMGMIKSSITVVDDIAALPAAGLSLPSPGRGGKGAAGGLGGCCGGGLSQ